MDYLEWNILEDDFAWAQQQYEDGNRSWLLVNCKVEFQGTIYSWCLHFDEYMHRKLVLQRRQMRDLPIPLSVVDETEEMIEYWAKEIREREQAEHEAGEDL